MGENTEKDLSIKEILRRLYQKIWDDDILGNAAQVAFYLSFALFPLLLFLMTLFGIILEGRSDLRSELFAILSRVMPASAYELVRSALTEVTSNASGGKLTIGVLLTLWSASAGFDNMRSTLNEVYNLEERRSWIRSRLTSVLLTVVIGILTLAALSFVVYGSQIISWVLPVEIPMLLEVIEWLTVLALILLAFALIYNFAPNHEPLKWKWISPGSVVGVILWLLLSIAFRVYLHFFDTYAATYGSLGAVIILLMWLYLTALVILIGGAINAIFDESAGIEKEAEDADQVKAEKEGTGKEARI